MPIKKIVKLLAVMAVFGISVAQAGADDYGIFKPNAQAAPQAVTK
jgi:hypothetical protein